MERILLSYGSGGKQTAELIKNVFLKKMYSKELSMLEDSAVLKNKNQKFAFTTDSYVVNPIFFPGGDIGKLCICGTVNDISVSGARIYAISLGFIIEEGLELDILLKIVDSISETAKEADAKIVTGDTKVVEKGKVDKIFINTSGIGFFDYNLDFSYKNVKSGDLIIINGEIASHGISVINARNNFGISGDIKSDVAPLNGLIDSIKRIKGIRCIKDVTRGGLITAINEICESSLKGAIIEEESVPVSPSVNSACAVLGIDPLYVANEGKIIVVVSPESAVKVLSVMKKHKYGKKSKIVGKFVSDKNVMVKTLVGTTRIAPSFSGEQMPRIC